MPKSNEIVNKQVDILKSSGLLFKKEKEAKQIILRENYYYITEGYKDVFKKEIHEESSNSYEDETYFEELYAIYDLDRELRNVVFDYVNMVETNLKSYVAYVFTEKYGERDYLKRENFKSGKSYDRTFEALKRQININLERNFNDELSDVKAFKEKYGYLPLLMLVKVFTFGNIATFFSLMDIEQRQRTSQYLQISPYMLEQYLKKLNIARNVCAHGGMLFNIDLNVTIKDNDIEYYSEFTSTNSNSDVKELHGIFALIFILKKLLSQKDFEKMFAKVENLLINVKDNIDGTSYDRLISLMGFPKNYKLLTTIKEKEAFDENNKPEPLDTNDIALNNDILVLAEELAKNNHDIWAKNRIEEGWKYGTVRDDNLKTSPDLIEYEQLPENEKIYDRETALETLKVIQKLGFKIIKEEQ